MKSLQLRLLRMLWLDEVELLDLNDRRLEPLREGVALELRAYGFSYPWRLGCLSRRWDDLIMMEILVNCESQGAHYFF